MARQSSSGAGGAVVGLVIFVFLWIVTLVIAIVFYNQRDEARKEQETAQKAVQEYFTEIDERNDRVRDFKAALNDFEIKPNGEVDAEGNTRDSVVAKAFNRVRGFRRVVTGADDKTYSDVRVQLRAIDERAEAANFGKNATGQGLVTLINDLLTNLQSERTVIGEHEETIKGLQQQVAEAQKSIEAITGEYENNVTQLKARIAQIESANAAALGQADAKFDSLGTQFEGARDTEKAKVADLEAKIDELLATIREKEIAIEKFRPLQQRYAPKAELEPDGRITKVSDNGSFAYVSLGSKQRVIPGMTFEVFDPATGVEADDKGILRGVATIELTNVNETSSVGRIVRTSNRDTTVKEGDLIANVVYDKNRTYKFYPFGDFDIDRTGRPSVADKRRIEGMISNWGGEVADDLTFDVDFLVLGVEPDLPEPLAADVIDPVIIAENAASMAKYTRYQELIGKASELSIPVLNQNRFLSLVGYYDR